MNEPTQPQTPTTEPTPPVEPTPPEATVEPEPEAEPQLEPSGASYKADAASQVYSGLTIEMRRYEQDGLWLFGVVVEGVFLPISQAKLGYIDTELAEAADPGHKQRLYDTYRREQLGLG